MTRKQLNANIYKAMPEVIRDERDWRLEQYSRLCGRIVKGTNDMDDDEAVLVYYCLRQNIDSEQVENEHFAAFDKDKKSHNQVLSLARQIGWINGRFADLNQLGEFIQSKESPVQRPLLLMKSQECSKLITALKGVLEYKMQKV